jgi:hypothetical protein
MKKINDVNDCRSGQDFGDYYRDQDGFTVNKKGSYLEITDGHNYAYAPDSPRHLPKPARANIIATLVKVGILVAVVAGLAMAFGML